MASLLAVKQFPPNLGCWALPALSSTSQRKEPWACLARRIRMPRKTIPTRRFRIYLRDDGRYVSLNDRPGDSPLGVDYSLNQAIGGATREATLASRDGCRVVIQVWQPNKRWKNVDVINPPGA